MLVKEVLTVLSYIPSLEFTSFKRLSNIAWYVYIMLSMYLFTDGCL